ncbi:MAG: lamin tail domain-containing protein, partial [Anaerolineae bacterium]
MKETKGLMWGALRVLALVVLLCLAVIAAASNPPGALGLHTATEGSAGSAAAALEVLPASGSVGAMFGIAGSGFQATEVTTLTINGPDGYSGASTVTVDNEGAFVLFWDSSHEPPGSYELTASGGAGSTAEASWDVRPGVLCGESDGFDASALDPAWSWVREDQSHWSLSAQPGALRIQTQAGTLTGAANDQRNLLLRQAPSGNYRLTVQLEVHADQDYQHAGVYLFQDDDHYVRLARGQSSHGVGQGVAFSVEAGGAYTATGTADAASVVYLKLGKQGDVYRGFHSRDGVLWRLVGQRQVAGLNPSQVGLSAANGNAPFATEIAADFEWLRVDELCGGVWLPVVLRAYAPVGRLLINEVMPEPGAGGSEWVELINVGPGPLDLGGHQVSDEDGHVYTIPEALPEVPMQGLVLIRFDGQGAGADDYDLGDKVAVLHSPSGLVDVFEDEGDQVAVYGGTPYGPETIVAFMAYGQHAGEDAANAAQARLWGRLWFVRRYLGLGLAPSDGGPDLSDYSLGLFPGSRVNIPRRWVRYTATESTPGAANPVPAPYFRNPPNGITTTDHQIPFGWSPVLGAVGYRLEVDDDPAFGSPALAVDVAGRIYVPTAPLPDGTFYFRAKTRLADGRESGWSASEQVTFISVAGPASPTSRVELGVTPQLQHKDSRMLCLEGCPRFNVTRWDSAHETDGDWVVGNADPVLISPHDTKYCTRASISMMADYFGGHLSQDRISYYQHSDRGPEGDLDHGSGMWPCESGTQDGTKCALAWALNDAVLISSRGKPTFDQVQDWIDMNRPIVIVEDWDQHTVVLDGYDTNGELAHRVDPWTSSASWVSWNGWVVSEYHVPPVGASARFDEASFSMDSDGDGITDFDEVNRFCTSPDDPDTDNDGIEDKVEIAAYVFAEDGLWEYREAADWETPPDGYRMECDVDNDGDTFPDGCEDSNHNGIFEPDLYETSNFDDDERTGCPELQVQPTVLDFGLNADTRTFEVVNAGGGGLAWEASSLPAWLSLSPDRHVTGPMARTDVEAVLDRSAVGGGKFDSFAIESDYGSLEIAVGAGADSDPPTVDSVSPTEPEPIWEAGCAGASTLDVEARVSDVGSGLDYVQLVFEEVGGQGGSGVPMELVRTPTSVRYEGVLGPVSGGSYEYWVLAADMAGSTSESDYYRIDVYECDPPQISTPDATPGELYLAPCRDGRLTVEVSVSDATGVDTVWLGYTIPAISPERQSVTMDPVGGDSYQATIGPFYTAGTLHFWVSAADTYGALAQTDEQTVEILACEGPTIGAVGQDVDEVTMPPCQPDQVMVFADPVTDDRALESVELWLRGPGDVGWNSGIPMQRRSGTDRWELAVGPLAEAGTWEWKVVARNQIGGQSESEISSTDVLTCGAEPPRFLGVHPDEQYLFLEPCTPDSTTIWAELAADFPLDQVNLLWSYGSDSGWWSVWSVVPMQFSDSTGEYGAGIGPLDAAGSIQ